MFTHLETHSYYTLLGSTISVSELANRAAADGMTHLALTDTNALYARWPLIGPVRPPGCSRSSG